MSHQPFETWILDHDRGTLTTDDRRELKAHLATCAQCQQLERRWKAVNQDLRARPMAAPAAGFARRWQAGLAERKAREQRRQAWRIFGGLLGIALFVLLVMGGYFFATTTPTDWLIAFIRSFESSRVFLQMAIFIVQDWFSTTPFAINLALWIYLTVTLCVLTLAWVTVIWRTKSVGVLNQ